MQTNFTPEQLADPAIAAVERHPADLRALRLLHRDLSDLPGARRRARQPARPHLPDQGHAGGRPPGRREDRQAHRPLPLLPRLHDDLPVGRRTTCTSSTMPAPTSRRPTAGRSPSGRCAALLARDPAVSGPLPRGAARRPARRGPSPALLPPAGSRRCSRWRRRRLPPASRLDAPQVLPGRGPAPQARGAPHRLRPARARPRHQRGDDPAPHPARLRGRASPRAPAAAGRSPTTWARPRESHASAAPTSRAWMREVDGEGLDAIVINTSGCGTTVKDYGHMFARRPATPARPRRSSALARDVTEVMAELGLRPPARRAEAARRLPRRLLAAARPADPRRSRRRCSRAAGFEVVEPRDGHLCCGSAGTYNLLQPEISRRAPRPQGRQPRGDGAAGDRRRQHRLHDADRRRHRRCRSSTRSSCSTGRRAARARAALAGVA